MCSYQTVRKAEVLAFEVIEDETLCVHIHNCLIKLNTKAITLTNSAKILQRIQN